MHKNETDKFFADNGGMSFGVSVGLAWPCAFGVGAGDDAGTITSVLALFAGGPSGGQQAG